MLSLLGFQVDRCEQILPQQKFEERSSSAVQSIVDPLDGCS